MEKPPSKKPHYRMNDALFAPLLLKPSLARPEDKKALGSRPNASLAGPQELCGLRSSQ